MPVTEIDPNTTYYINFKIEKKLEPGEHLYVAGSIP